MLSIKDLSVAFKTRKGEVNAVRGVSLNVGKGETLGIVGESGSGKSVTSYALMRILDAGGEQIILKDGSTNVGHIDLDSDNLTIKSLVQDKDILFKGNDGGSEITALSLDMSDLGTATFSGGVKSNSYFWMTTDNNVAMYGGANFEIALNQ